MPKETPSSLILVCGSSSVQVEVELEEAVEVMSPRLRVEVADAGWEDIESMPVSCVPLESKRDNIAGYPTQILLLSDYCEVFILLGHIQF